MSSKALSVVDVPTMVRMLIREPLYRHRKKLGRCYSFPADFVAAQRLAEVACKAAGLKVSEIILHTEANKMTCAAARDLFPASEPSVVSDKAFSKGCVKLAAA